MRHPAPQEGATLRARCLLGLSVAMALLTLAAAVAEGRRRGRHRSRRHRAKIARYVIAPGSATHVLKPLESIGVDRKRVKHITVALQEALVKVPGVKMASLRNSLRFLRSRYGATYAVCEGELKCVVKFGLLLKAPLVVTGDLSGLGSGFVLFLRLVDPKAQKVLRKVTIVHGGRKRQQVLLREAAFRLLAPERFLGKLKLSVDVPGAAVFLNGKPLGKSPIKVVSVEAGTHALRVTHAEYHDYMAFVDVGFEKTTEVKVFLKQFPIISEEMKHKGHRRAGPVEGVLGRKVLYRPIPWYKRWWFITSVGVTLLAATLTTVALSKRRHLDRDGSITLSRSLRAPAAVVRFGR